MSQIGQIHDILRVVGNKLIILLRFGEHTAFHLQDVSLRVYQSMEYWHSMQISW